MKVAFQSFAAKLKSVIGNTAEKRAFDSANILRNHFLVALSNSPQRTGKVYKVPGTDRTYTASAPGEYPALRLGQLRASLGKAISVSKGGNSVQASLGGSIAKHGIYLEQGKDGPPGSGIRPWFSMGIEEKRSDMLKALQRRWF